GSQVLGVAGIFELRGVPIPAINTAQVLGDKQAPVSSSQQLIVVEFSNKRAGFIVDGTEKIRRVSWDKVLPPSSDSGSFMTGMILLDDSDFLFILDLERILDTIDRSAGGEGVIPRPPVEDSPTMVATTSAR